MKSKIKQLKLTIFLIKWNVKVCLGSLRKSLKQSRIVKQTFGTLQDKTLCLQIVQYTQTTGQKSQCGSLTKVVPDSYINVLSTASYTIAFTWGPLYTFVSHKCVNVHGAHMKSKTEA